MSTDAQGPGGTSRTFCPDPEVFFPAPGNTEKPDGAGTFKSPEEEEDGTLRCPPPKHNETTTGELTTTLGKETRTPK
ncbi:hypothetical protein NDU88_003246 [Pleurodeles waltl]|uniref:Uncharacterized protein n=1 Tax=Pleurodeles waltl TaxID=8319 RepID=A0AAV7VGU1_PLEWA|nr:hypothetical protein NDU88_003246 [Pleurodeles waltl]